uniref:PhoH-like protein n=1 Tax=viral metagenome TaxID=1070528 RepID=A0A6C0ARK8_9ZZZZ
MNILRILCLVSFLFNTLSYTSIIRNKKHCVLHMKKTKTSKSPLYKPKNINQDNYVSYLNNDNTKILISTGPAGCGKTLFACQKAVLDLLSSSINKIVITRPIVTVDEELGFLPGNIIKKMDPWTKPLFDIFLEYYSKSELDLMLKNEEIEICPLAFMRGRTFKNTFIIADEMQNSSPNQMKMLITRLGENSRLVITGDLEQTDREKENGLEDFISKLDNFNDSSDLIHRIHFHSTDIERSEVVKKIVDIYNYKKTNISIYETATAIQTIIVNQTLISNQDITKQNYTVNFESDCALIPKKDITKNYHRFIEGSEF